MIKRRLIQYDQSELTDWNLIYKQHRKINLVMNCLLIVVSVGLLLWPLYKFEAVYCIAIPPGIMIAYLAGHNVRKETLRILKKENEKYSLKIEEEWDYYTLEELRFKKLKQHIEDEGIKLNRDKIPSIINSLNAENIRNSYSYVSINIVIPVTIALLSAFLGATLATAADNNEKFQLVKIITQISAMIILSIIYAETWIIKPIIIKRKNQHLRLIKALESIHQE